MEKPGDFGSVYTKRQILFRRVPEKKQAVSGSSGMPKQRGKRRSVSIRLQLLAGFLLPVFFVVLVGWISYKKTEEGMIGNYEASVRTMIDTQMEYLDFGLSMIRMDGIQVKTDQELQNLMAGVYARDLTKAFTTYNKNLSDLSMKKTLNTFIGDIYIIPEAGNQVLSTADSASRNGFFEKWAETEEGSSVMAKDHSGWVGSHPEMDALTGYDPEG